MKKLTLISALFSLFLLAGCKQGLSKFGCPKIEEVQKIVDGLQKGIIVEKVIPAEVHGLCSVVIKISETDRGMFYLDSKGKYLLSGSIVEIATRRNLTQEKLADLNRVVLNANQLSELEKRVAFIHGKADKFVYFITDPDCPFCKKAEEMLDELVKAGKIAVKVVLFPLEQIHPDAKAKSISIVCDNKGFEGLRQGYRSNNQCESGKKLVEDTQSFISNLKIRGTPTFIFPDGELRSGLLPKEFILQKLEIKS